MTTYSFEALLATYNDEDDSVAVAPGLLELVLPDFAGPSFTYSVEIPAFSQDDEDVLDFIDIPFENYDGPPLQLEFNNLPLDSYLPFGGVEDIELEFGFVQTPLGSFTVLVLNLASSVSEVDVDVIMQVSGGSLFDLVLEADDPAAFFEDFGDSISGGGGIRSGPFAPGQSIRWDDLSAFTSVTENDNFTLTPLDDEIGGGVGNDLILGDAGNDTIYGAAGDDTLIGGTGNDLLGGSPGDDNLNGSQGDDAVWGAAGDDTLQGESGNDTLGGAIGDDSLLGGSGHDELWTAAGDDTGHGGEGNDTLGGADGDDELYGDAGSDELWGATGDDTLYGGGDGDTLGGFTGDDVLYGDGGNDELWGADGADALNGGAGNDTLGAGNDNDTLDGGDGNDEVYGGRGDDVMQGGAGNDTLAAFDGDDTLGGGTGDDILFGGAGADVFEYVGGNDTIGGYATPDDTLALSEALWGGGLTEAQVLALADDISGTVIFDFGGGNTLTMNGITDTDQLIGELAFI